MSRSAGCEFYPTRMAIDGFSSCFAVFVVNTWDTPAHLNVAYGNSPLPIGSSAFLPEGNGPELEYLPYDEETGLAPGAAAVLFLVENALGQCPRPAATTRPPMPDTGKGSSFHLTSDVPVAAYQVQPYGSEESLTGASLLLPTSAWDTSYIAVNGNQDIAELEYSPSLNIVGMEDNTQVSLTPVVELEGGGGIPAALAGETIQMTLNSGVYIQITQAEELSGSRITADKPIGLLGGHECMQVPLGEDFCDHGEQMIPPVRALGHEYVAVMHKPRADEGSYWRLFGVVDGTELSWS
ncbi:MAG: IgGFc-binding protein, partial [Nannocystaceae bacterium]